jgi:hypothetical protein
MFKFIWDVEITAIKIMFYSTNYFVTRGGAIGWGTALQAGKFAGSIPDGVMGLFLWLKPYSRAMFQGSTQPLTEMSTRTISWRVKAASA